MKHTINDNNFRALISYAAGTVSYMMPFVATKTTHVPPGHILKCVPLVSFWIVSDRHQALLSMSL
jgi:hypothetical protein